MQYICACLSPNPYKLYKPNWTKKQNSTYVQRPWLRMHILSDLIQLGKISNVLVFPELWQQPALVQCLAQRSLSTAQNALRRASSPR